MFLILICVVAAILLYLAVPKRPTNFPPGPSGLPLVGNLFQIGLEHYKWAMKMEKTYGDIVGFRLGTQWVVYLNNPNDIREAFSMPEFSGRTGFNYIADKRVEDFNYGVINSSGPKWVDIRRFALKTLRQFGFANRSSEKIILVEVRETIEAFKKRAGKPCESHTIFYVSVFNVIWCLVSNTRYAQDDPEVDELIRLFHGFATTQLKGLRPLLFIFPELINLCKDMPLFTGVESPLFLKTITKFIAKTVQEHRETFKPGEPRDFIDTMLEENIKKPGTFNDIDFEILLCDLFITGFQTTSTTLIWSLFSMAMHPNIQEKVFQEIRGEVGHAEVTMSDRAKLKYLDVVCNEIYRTSTIAPSGTFHATTEDVMYKGYFFPKSTTVLPNLYASHFSKDIWGDPENFRPERFRANDEKSPLRLKALIPFGAGKRMCLGESLVRDEFFLFFANLIQNFKFSFPPGEKPHTIAGHPYGTIRNCGRHTLMVECRE